LEELITERAEQKRLDDLFMQATLSPGGRLTFVDPQRKVSLNPDEISNPFIEKSDIVNHKRKIYQLD